MCAKVPRHWLALHRAASVVTSPTIGRSDRQSTPLPAQPSGEPPASEYPPPPPRPRNEFGDALVEYALIILAVAMAAIAILAVVGWWLAAHFDQVLIALGASGNATVRQVMQAISEHSDVLPVVSVAAFCILILIVVIIFWGD